MKDNNRNNKCAKNESYRSVDNITNSWVCIPFAHSSNKCDVEQFVALFDFLKVLENDLNAFLVDDAISFQWLFIVLFKIIAINQIDDD